VFDLVQNRFWACTGQQYGSTKKYRTCVAPRSAKESRGSWRMQPIALRLTLSARARVMSIRLLVNVSDGSSLQRLDTFAGESVA
jgi:hypothetical protein